MERLIDIPLSEITADDEWNCRMTMIPMTLRTLAKSIQDLGLQQPVVLDPKMKLIMGYRRFHAHKLLVKEGHEQFSKIKAIIQEEALDEEKAKILNLTENFHRKNLNMLEEAKALEYFKDLYHGNRQKIAKAVNMSDGWVQERLMLLKLPVEVQVEAAGGHITSVAIRELYRIFRQDGKNAGFEALRKYKDAKRRGEKISLAKRKVDPFSKRKRTPVEIKALRDKLYQSLGPGVYNDRGVKGTCWVDAQLAVQALSWVVGDVSDIEFCATAGAYAKRGGCEFEQPEVDD